MNEFNQRILFCPALMANKGVINRTTLMAREYNRKCYSALENISLMTEVGGSSILKTYPWVCVFMKQMKRKSPFLTANCLMSDRCCYNHDYRILFNSEQKYLGLTVA